MNRLNDESSRCVKEMKLSNVMTGKKVLLASVANDVSRLEHCEKFCTNQDFCVNLESNGDILQNCVGAF